MTHPEFGTASNNQFTVNHGFAGSPSFVYAYRVPT